MKPAQIVLIEDNPADVLLVEMALKEHGIYNVLTRFESGAEAVEVLCAPNGAESCAPDAVLPDVILLDLNTPRTDGFEALLQLRQCPHLALVPIAILTSSRARRDKHRAALQKVRYIEKPSELKDFLDAVGAAVREMLAAAPRCET